MKRLLLGSMALAAVLAWRLRWRRTCRSRSRRLPPVLYRLDRRLCRLQHRRYLARGRSVLSEPDRRFFPAVDVSLKRATDVIIGFHGGAQWQFGMFVFGVEAASAAASGDGKHSGRCRYRPFNFGPAAFVRAQDQPIWSPSARGFGFAWDRFIDLRDRRLLARHGQLRERELWSGDLPDLCWLASDTDSECWPSKHSGVTWKTAGIAGAGFEYMVHKGPLVDAIVGLEYQHLEVGSDRRSASIPAAIVANRTSTSATARKATSCAPA